MIHIAHCSMLNNTTFIDKNLFPALEIVQSISHKIAFNVLQYWLLTLFQTKILPPSTRNRFKVLMETNWLMNKNYVKSCLDLLQLYLQILTLGQGVLMILLCLIYETKLCGYKTKKLNDNNIKHISLLILKISFLTLFGCVDKITLDINQK